MDFQDYEDKENLPPAHSDYVSNPLKKSSKGRKNKQLTIAEKARVLRNRVQNKYNEWVAKGSVHTEGLENQETILDKPARDSNIRF